MSTRIQRGRRVANRAGAVAVAIAVALAGAACDNLLNVDVPGQVTEEEVFVPGQARLVVNSAIADIECALSDFVVFEAAGFEDASRRVVGWYGGSMEYPITPPGGQCSVGPQAYGWFSPMHKGRWLAEQIYQHLEGWTVEQVPAREELMATAAIYAGIAYAFLGDVFCEVSADVGPLMTWQESLAVAETWFTRALGHIAAGGDFAIPTGVTDSAEQMAYLLRARARLAMGNTDGARGDAERVTMGFGSFVTRDGGEVRQRWNRPYDVHIGQNGWLIVLGPVDWVTNSTDPVTGQPWPTPIPFTGYWNLGVLPDGRAISDTRHPITTTAHPEAVADSRVAVTNLNRTVGPGYPAWVQAKYPTLDADIPLAKWEEAWLIRAEVAGGQTAINLVNQIRAEHNLPQITYLSAGDEAGIRNMIIEEIRRVHFMEGRYWAAKLRHNLWFPRGQGGSPLGHAYRTGVRLVMPGAEYDLNPNFTEAERGSGCTAFQSPV